ncbi:MAG: hypothetical protein A4S16_03895 [Proteobacteria bacterium SG_bin6]|nr:MAG: hypothetical protein A4S16_03895 [Proteobacteria bacterium SG_bin6]
MAGTKGIEGDGMEQQRIDSGQARRARWRRDLLIALALVAILSFSRAARDWPQLSRLILPDADDMMRLAQIRDWLGGQAFNDWTQYRMAPPAGSPMHWSRLNDFVPAAMIMLSTPLLGQHGAELVAVSLYPPLLLVAAMLLIASIARKLWRDPAAPVAIVLMALAFPATSLFVPGRIDHHALQVVTVLVAARALIARPTGASGLIAGLAMACSLMIGLETLPQVVGLIGAAGLIWVVRGTRESARLAGLAAGLGGLTLVFLLTMRPNYWPNNLCDSFTPASSAAILGESAVLALLAGATPWLRGPIWRAGIGAVGAIGTALAVLHAYPACLAGPYGQVDPFLLKNFITHIDEANSVFAQDSVVRVIGLAGLMIAGIVAALWALARAGRRWPLILPIAGAVLASGLVILAQLRGVYLGVPLSVPLLAGFVARVRKTGRAVPMVAAWLGSAGVAYAFIPDTVDRLTSPPPPPGIAISRDVTAQILCNRGDTWAAVDRYPAGVIMAPTNMASYLVGSTHHATVGAGYHRNNAGNIAMYRFFLSPAAAARPIGRLWRIDYVAFCPGDFEEIDLLERFPHSLAADLARDRAPAGFERLALGNSRLRLWRVRRWLDQP